MSKLIITLEPNNGKDDIMRELIQLCSDKTNVAGKITEAVNDTDEYIFSIKFKNAIDTISFIDQLFFQVEAPDEGYEDIDKKDFSVFSDGEDKKVSSYLITRLHKSLQYDIQLLDLVASSIAEDTEILIESNANTRKRLEAIEEYLKKSGIIYYQQFMGELVDVLGDAGLVDKDSINNKLFNTLH